MSTLPTGFADLIAVFAPLFSPRVFQSMKILLAGAILAIGKRTIPAVLRIMGLEPQPHFQTYHRVFNRAVSSALAASRIVLSLLAQAFAPHGPLIFGLDDTIERRWGAKIAACFERVTEKQYTRDLLFSSVWAVFQAMTQQMFVEVLVQLAQNAQLSKYKKHGRGPKIKAPARPSAENETHVSTAQLLREAKSSP